uniref:Ubiquitin conjugating enzyme E2 U n=1 Tax=Sphenodon punctatus TaxID=8508 RepID=A0A8D0HKM5_SPHPU
MDKPTRLAIQNDVLVECSTVMKSLSVLGAGLQLSLKYTEKYNTVPPAVTFNTIPFHPNVDQQSGKPCLDFLDNPKDWDPKLTMSDILLAIQVMLSNPVLENAVNLEAAAMLQNDIDLYRRVVIQCVRASKHLEGISFEDYRKTWSAIATSKAAEHFKTPCKWRCLI